MNNVVIFVVVVMLAGCTIKVEHSVECKPEPSAPVIVKQRIFT